MPDDDDVDVRLLLPHAAGLRGAGRGGRRWGGRWERCCLLGEAAGEEAGASKEAPPFASPLPSPSGKAVLPSPHLPAGPRGRGCPASSGSSARAGSEPAWPRRRPQPGYFGLPRPASKSRQDAVFFGILPSTTLAETPGSQGYVIDASKVPFLPWKTSLRLRAAFSLFPNPRASPPWRGCPGRSRGCPSSRAALATPQLGTVQVTTGRQRNGVDKNSPPSRAANSGAAEGSSEPALGGVFILFCCRETGWNGGRRLKTQTDISGELSWHLPALPWLCSCTQTGHN